MIKKIIKIILVFIVLIGVFYLLSRPPKEEIVYQDPDLIFYWGNGCPHCETVQEWLKDNNQQNTLKINSKEVYKNQVNSKELLDTVNQYCPQLKGESGIGVPTGFDPVGQKCYQGSEEIINFLSDKLTK